MTVGQGNFVFLMKQLDGAISAYEGSTFSGYHLDFDLAWHGPCNGTTHEFGLPTVIEAWWRAGKNASADAD